MPQVQLFAERRLRICYWSVDARLVDSNVMELERHLERLGAVDVAKVKALDAQDFHPCDLLIVAAQRVAVQDFARWLSGLRQRIAAQGGIWVPALILADVPFDVLAGVLPEAVAENWYFDILTPEHMASLPIRVANLLRIHDHLHELQRYEAAVDEVSTKVKMLESQLQGLRSTDKKLENGP